MSQGLLPSRHEVTVEPRDDYRIGIDEDAADGVFGALAVDKRREMLRKLDARPMTASKLASATDTSVQNVTHHLDTLEDADLVEVVDTWYSSRGQEMSVYAPRLRALVVDCTGGSDS